MINQRENTVKTTSELTAELTAELTVELIDSDAESLSNDVEQSLS